MDDENAEAKSTSKGGPDCDVVVLGIASVNGGAIWRE
jgi:hypothetical protein